MNKPTTSNELHVIFGTGPLGKSVMRELIQCGKRVRMVNRSGKAADVPANVEIAASDAYDPEKVRQLTAGASVVYQCAQPAYQDWVTRFPPLQVSIVEGIAAHTTSGTKLVVGDNLYMYGEVAGPIRENLPYGAHTRKGKVRAQMSESLLAAHKSGKVRVAIGRGADFFGPDVLDSTIGDRAMYPALAGKSASLVGNIDLPHTLTYINDFGKALVILGERDEASGQIWHVPNAETVTQREFMTMVFSEIGLPPKMSGMGRLMMQMGGIFVVGARETVEMMYEFEKPFVVDSSKFEKAFGMHATPLRESIHDLVHWYKTHPQQKH